VRSLIIALQFLTRIRLFRNLSLNEGDFAGAIKFFPFIGLLLGFILALLYSFGRFFLEPFALAVLLVVAEIILTGGLHLDGLMDSFDAFLSGKDRDRKLDIMKDSRVGAMGVLALACLVLVKLALYTELPHRQMVPALLLMPVLGRWAAVYAIVLFPYARTEGMGRTFSSNNVSDLLIASLFSLALFIWLTPSLYFYLSLPVFVVFALFICERSNAQLGGLTGDSYGMIIELSEAAYLLGMVLLSKI
jgi:adenosylcobinamide-GDP ribazoletransferase